MSAPVLALAALAGSIVLLTHRARRPDSLIAVAVSSAEVLVAFGVVHLGAYRMLELIFGGALVVVGVLLWTRANSKNNIAAATIVAFVGALQVLSALH